MIGLPHKLLKAQGWKYHKRPGDGGYFTKPGELPYRGKVLFSIDYSPKYRQWTAQVGSRPKRRKHVWSWSSTWSRPTIAEMLAFIAEGLD